MNYYDSIPNGFFVSKCAVMVLDFESFLSLIQNNKINDVYRVDADSPSLMERGLSDRTDAGYFFCVIYENVIHLMAPMGFPDLETLEDALSNDAFMSISVLKHDKKEGFWSRNVGMIYTHLHDLGYKTGKQIREAYEFFNGEIYYDYEKFLKCKREAKKGNFSTFEELCIAKEAGFENDDDLYDAERFKAPNAKSLQAVRILRDIKRKFHFKDLSESLLAGVIATLAFEEADKKSYPIPLELHSMWYRFNHWFPEILTENFRKMESESDMISFLDSTRGRTIGALDTPNQLFRFSAIRIYIDGSNIAHRGTKKGEPNHNLPFPSMKVLEKCYNQLKAENIGNVQIYMDELKAKKIKDRGSQEDKRIFNELFSTKTLLTTLGVEEADDRLIQKLRDDPFAYVVVNDDYTKDHSLTEKDLNRIINVKFLGEEFEFYGRGYELAKAHSELFSKVAESADTLYHTYELGVWPFNSEQLRYRLYQQGCC